jgi:hypothetical protein
MNHSPRTRVAALALSAFMTLACVHAIASYAYPEPADARLALASSR